MRSYDKPFMIGMAFVLTVLGAAGLGKAYKVLESYKSLLQLEEIADEKGIYYTELTPEEVDAGYTTVTPAKVAVTEYHKPKWRGITDNDPQPGDGNWQCTVCNYAYTGQNPKSYSKWPGENHNE